MKTPPEMLSPKDCSYLADLLETIYTLCKKANQYTEEIEDEEVKSNAQEHTKLYREHYTVLLELLKDQI